MDDTNIPVKDELVGLIPVLFILCDIGMELCAPALHRTFKGETTCTCLFRLPHMSTCHLNHPLQKDNPKHVDSSSIWLFGNSVHVYIHIHAVLNRCTASMFPSQSTCYNYCCLILHHCYVVFLQPLSTDLISLQMPRRLQGGRGQQSLPPHR